MKKKLPFEQKLRMLNNKIGIKAKAVEYGPKGQFFRNTLAKKIQKKCGT